MNLRPPPNCAIAATYPRHPGGTPILPGYGTLRVGALSTTMIGFAISACVTLRAFRPITDRFRSGRYETSVC
jgi:hypothetical protein